MSTSQAPGAAALTRRVTSWLLCAAVAWLAAATVMRLPGAGGPLEELRWLLRSRDPTREAVGAASAIVGIIAERTPGREADLFAELLADANDSVIRNALLIACNQVSPVPERARLAQVVGEWLMSTPLERRIAFLPESGYVTGALVVNDLYPAEPSPTVERWMLAIGARPGASGSFTNWMRAESGEVLAGRMNAHMVHHGPPPGEWAPIRGDVVERAARFLHDPIREVRWGAARVLAAARDERCLPVIREWLDEGEPRPGPLASREISDLFGPNWVARAAVIAASQPAASESP